MKQRDKLCTCGSGKKQRCCCPTPPQDCVAAQDHAIPAAVEAAAQASKTDAMVVWIDTDSKFAHVSFVFGYGIPAPESAVTSRVLALIAAGHVVMEQVLLRIESGGLAALDKIGRKSDGE